MPRSYSVVDHYRCLELLCRQTVRKAGPDFAAQNFTWRHAIDRPLQVILPELTPTT